MRRSEKIIHEVAARRGLKVKDILGRGRYLELIAARRECMLAMRAARMTQANIGAAMNRHPSTVLQYTNPEYTARKELRRASPELCAPRPYYWSIEETRVLAEIYATANNQDLANKFGRTAPAIQTMASKLGLKKQKRGRPVTKPKRDWMAIAAKHEFMLSDLKVAA